MDIVLSAHFDLNKQVKYIKIKKGKMEGLVDNFAGVFTAYKAVEKTGIPLYLTNFEEQPGYKGAVAVARSLNPKTTIVIVVDTCTDCQNKAAYIGNAYGIATEKLKKKFGNRVLFKDGYYEQDYDETYIYGSRFKYKTFFFGVPISKAYHDVDNKINLAVIDKASKVLIDLIKVLKANPEIVIG